MRRDPGALAQVGTGGESSRVTWWQVLFGVLGWVAVALILANLILDASHVARQLSAVVFALALFVAVLGAIIAGRLVRPNSARGKAVEPAKPGRAHRVDRLGRVLADQRDWSKLDGELTMMDGPEGRHPVSMPKDVA